LGNFRWMLGKIRSAEEYFEDIPDLRVGICGQKLQIEVRHQRARLAGRLHRVASPIKAFAHYDLLSIPDGRALLQYRVDPRHGSH